MLFNPTSAPHCSKSPKIKRTAWQKYVKKATLWCFSRPSNWSDTWEDFYSEEVSSDQDTRFIPMIWMMVLFGAPQQIFYGSQSPKYFCDFFSGANYSDSLHQYPCFIPWDINHKLSIFKRVREKKHKDLSIDLDQYQNLMESILRWHPDTNQVLRKRSNCFCVVLW